MGPTLPRLPPRPQPLRIMRSPTFSSVRPPSERIFCHDRGASFAFHGPPVRRASGLHSHLHRSGEKRPSAQSFWPSHASRQRAYRNALVRTELLELLRMFYRIKRNAFVRTELLRTFSPVPSPLVSQGPPASCSDRAAAHKGRVPRRSADRKAPPESSGGALGGIRRAHPRVGFARRSRCFPGKARKKRAAGRQGLPGKEAQPPPIKTTPAPIPVSASP